MVGVEEARMDFRMDRVRLVKLLKMVQSEGQAVRLEASGSSLVVTGPAAEAQVPAEVEEPGVLFLHAELFRRMLRMLNASDLGGRDVTIRVDAAGLQFADTRLGLERYGMHWFPDPTTAPIEPPDDPWVDPRAPTEQQGEAGQSPPGVPGPQGRLFDGSS